MNDEAAEVADAREEGLTHPQQVLFTLLLERHGGIGSRMHEEAAAIIEGQRQRCDPAAMLERQFRRLLDTVAQERARASLKDPEKPFVSLPAHRPEHQCLVVSFETDHLSRHVPLQLEHGLNNAATVGPAVDIVSQEHKPGRLNAAMAGAEIKKS